MSTEQSEGDLSIIFSPQKKEWSKLSITSKILEKYDRKEEQERISERDIFSQHDIDPWSWYEKRRERDSFTNTIWSVFLIFIIKTSHKRKRGIMTLERVKETRIATSRTEPSCRGHWNVSFSTTTAAEHDMIHLQTWCAWLGHEVNQMCRWCWWDDDDQNEPSNLAI
jgi:hypothetical protein